MKKEVLLLIENGFRDEEVIYPYYRFKEAGYNVIIIGPKSDKEYTGKFGIPVKSDLTPGQVNFNNVAAVIIPGGNAPARMIKIKEMVNLVREASLKNRVIAAICRGGLMLAEAELVKNKNVTGFMEISGELKAAGGNYIDAEAVVDGNLVTSRIPDDLPAFCRSIFELLREKKSQ